MNEIILGPSNHSECDVYPEYAGSIDREPAWFEGLVKMQLLIPSPHDLAEWGGKGGIF